MKNTPANALINETSPYLLQHAHNPVHWYPWSDEAFELAKKNDLPILVSIGYSACHWCHVMEKESFEDEVVAAYMNLHFINIKIDREERPDLDHFYMDALQAMSGSGGWPLNVFITTDKKPFYGGTYFPPQKAFNRSSWQDVLHSIVDIWKNKRDEVEQQAEEMIQHLQKSNGFSTSKKLITTDGQPSFYSQEKCKQIALKILDTADRQYGGFGKAPKFLQTASLKYLFQYAHLSGDKDSLKHGLLTLQKMLYGGIYDQLGGGISRYSTDNEWLLPHFEKMLYDNALLVNVLCDACQLTGDEQFKNAIKYTLEFIFKELKDPLGGYYTAIDADSEGVEGKFYVWNKEEIVQALGNDTDIFCVYYNITASGNWEGDNILNVTQDAAKVAALFGISMVTFNNTIHTCRQALIAYRNKRVAPALDDKLLLNCNSLLLTALCKAYASMQDPQYKAAAEELYLFIEQNFKVSGGNGMYHTYKNGVAKHPAFLDDYAYLIEGLIQLQEITANQLYLNRAKDLTEYVLFHFKDDESPFFYYTSRGQKDILVRKIEIYDGVTPSANAVMAQNLLYLGIVFDEFSWREKGINMLSALENAIQQHPTSFAVWASCYLNQSYGINEIAITGEKTMSVLNDILWKYIPNKILQCSIGEPEVYKGMPLLINKKYTGRSNIYLCKNFVCLEPVTRVEELLHLIKNLSIR